MDVDWFWCWFEKKATDFALESDTIRIVDEIYEMIIRLDERISVEVSEPDSSGIRELIISATGHPELFCAVENLASAGPALHGWKFTGLKPPRGFEFVYRKDGHTLSPSEWSFLPLYDDENNLGLKVFISGKPSTISESILWTIIETGVGEKGLSQVHHLEYTQCSDALAHDSWLKLTALPEFLEWKRHRR